MGTTSLRSMIRETLLQLDEKTRSKHGVHWGDETTFNLKSLEKFTSPDTCLAYASKFLEKMGVGSSRTTFVISTRFALKVAMNDAGIAQNRTEVRVASDPRSKIACTRVHTVGPNTLWIVVQLVKPIQSEKEFEQLTKVSWTDFQAELRKCMKESVEPKSDFVGAVCAIAKSQNIKIGDLIKEVGAYGKTSDSRVVLLDYGFDEQTFQSHYKKKDNVGDEDATVATKKVANVAPVFNDQATGK
jgi:hypothetical protein